MPSTRKPRDHQGGTWQGAGGGFAGGQVEMVRVLERDPELGHHLSPQALKRASAAAIAPLLGVDEGPASFLIDEPGSHAHLGLLVLDGLIARHLSFGQIGASEFYAPGDLMRPWVRRRDTAEFREVRWEVLAPAQLATLDQDFAYRVRAWPEIAAALLDRTAQRSDSQTLQAALHQGRRIEDRVLLALWHFAGRWGQIGPEARVVKLPNITGELLARFVGARRQSVSTALGDLADSGALKRGPNGTVILPHEPPQLGQIQPGRRATDRKPRLRQRA